MNKDLVPKDAEPQPWPVYEKPSEPSVAILCGEYPNLAEFIRDKENELEQIKAHYNILRADLVEREARDLYGGFQAAACYKDLDTCRTIANARLRGKCSGCEGRGEVGGQFPDGSYQTDPCPHCEGNGFVEIPELPSGTESETHNNQLADKRS